MRFLSHRARLLARLDRPLLDRLATMPADRQLRIAVWAARRAMRVAGLDRMDWIAEALHTVEAGGKLPTAFTELGGIAAIGRLLNDPATPRTLITLPGDPSESVQQTAAFPALLALGYDDPLAAAVDAVYSAAIAFGEDDYAAFLTEVPTHDD